MNRLTESLNRRLRRNRSPWPTSYWKIFLLVSVNLVAISFLLFDAPVASVAATRSPTLVWIGERMTNLGKSGWILIASAMLFVQAWAASMTITVARARYRALLVCHTAFYVFLSVALSGLSANLLKRAIGRARPELFHDWGIAGFSPFAGDSDFESFPSGHSTTIGAIFMAAALLAPRYRVVCLILGIWFGMTRIVVDAHYPSDVIAGLAFGAWFALLTAIVFSRYGLVFRTNDTGFPELRQPLLLLGDGRKQNLRAISIDRPTNSADTIA